LRNRCSIAAPSLDNRSAISSSRCATVAKSLLSRSAIIAQSLRNRVAVAVQSLRNRVGMLRNLCAVAAQSRWKSCGISVESRLILLLNHCAIAAESLCDLLAIAAKLLLKCSGTEARLRWNRCAIAALSLRYRCAVAAQSLCSRGAVALQSRRSRGAIAAQSRRGWDSLVLLRTPSLLLSIIQPFNPQSSLARLQVPTCEKAGVQILAYGSLLGGFLSDYWLGKPDPAEAAQGGLRVSKEITAKMKNVSLRKYLPWIRYW
jgi:hypothetical protein